MTSAQFSLFETALGLCAIAWDGDRAIVCTQLPEGGEAQARQRMQKRLPGAIMAPPPAVIRSVIARIIALLAGGKDDLCDVVLDMDAVPEFNRDVYTIARTIPPGATMTYGDIARRLGGLERSRDVGQALGQNPFPIIVPCHRVLAAGGKPGGFSARGGAATKLKMLAIEGAYVNHTPSLFDDAPVGNRSSAHSNS